MTRRITVRSGAVPRKVIPPASAASISIEPTFLVAASDARPAIIAVADYVCDGTADEVQINAALTAVAALAQGGIVQLSSGLFSCADQITHTTGSKQIWLRGTGRSATLIETSGNAPSTRNGIIYLIAPYATISDLGADVNHNGYRNVIYLDVTTTTVGALQRVTVGMFSPTVTNIDAAIFVGNDIEVYDVEVTESSKGDGIWAFGNSGRVNIGGVQIHSATTDGNGNGWGIRLGGNLTSCRVHDSFLENCAVAGIWVAADNSIITGNDVADGIVIDGVADGTVLGDNIGTVTDNGTNTNISEDADAIHDNVDGEIILVTEKVSPVGADVLLIEDSEDGDAKKRVQVTNLPGGADADAIHDNVAAEISAIVSKATPINADFLLIEDSAAGDAKKKITIGDLPSSGTSPLTTKGDVFGYDTNIARIPVGANDQVLTADSTQALGVKWAAGGGGGGSIELFDLLYSTKASSDTPDDEFDSETLDGKWTAVVGSVGTVDFTGGPSSGNAIYDLTSRLGWLLLQGNNLRVELRQDYTLPDGECMVLAMSAPVNFLDGTLVNNIVLGGISLNDTDTGFEDGNESMINLETDSGGYRIRARSNGSNVSATNPSSEMAFSAGSMIYLRIARDGLVYRFSYSVDGTSWAGLSSHTAGAAYTNVFIYGGNLVAGTPAPILAFAWIRQGTNDFDPWDPTITVLIA